MALSKCSIGSLRNEACHLKTFTKQESFLEYNNLKATDKVILQRRLQIIDMQRVQNLCAHHAHKYLTYFSTLKKACCNPFGKHKKSVTSTTLREIDLETCEEIGKLGISLIPGEKVCIRCRIKLEEKCRSEKNVAHPHQDSNISEPSTSRQTVNNRYNLRPLENKNSHESNYNSQDFNSQKLNSQNLNSQNSCSSQSDADCLTISQKRQNINEKLDSLGCSRLPLSKKNIRTEKLSENAMEIIDNVVSTLKAKIETAYDIELPEVSVSYYKDHEAINALVEDVKKKYEMSTSYNERIQLLTLLPNHWNFQMVSAKFNCTRYLFSEAQKLKNEKGKYK